MLEITLKRDEMVYIGDNVSIKVTDIGRGRVKLGITAPRAVLIHRAEIVWHDEAPPPARDAS